MKKLFILLTTISLTVFPSLGDTTKTNNLEVQDTTKNIVVDSLKTTNNTNKIVVEKDKTDKVQKVATYGRCQATTKKGTQCKRNAAAGSKFCWQHK